MNRSLVFGFKHRDSSLLPDQFRHMVQNDKVGGRDRYENCY